MPSGNGCRVNKQRERNEKKNSKGANKHDSEDLKKHEQSKNAVQCTVCFQGFPRTVRRPELEQHMQKHDKSGKTFEELYPAFSE
ncbi:Zinc-binding, putative [Angomonas deanei]|uniref:Zinc-binding, putative n=1 Tax=Angomonas deanei TaxID=59799 RepID=A0A7G2CWW0_9TRYP|nr:Zinc-binding, putative [Angomonas deanei]